MPESSHATSPAIYRKTTKKNTSERLSCISMLSARTILPTSFDVQLVVTSSTFHVTKGFASVTATTVLLSFHFLNQWPRSMTVTKQIPQTEKGILVLKKGCQHRFNFAIKKRL